MLDKLRHKWQWLLDTVGHMVAPDNRGTLSRVWQNTFHEIKWCKSDFITVTAVYDARYCLSILWGIILVSCLKLPRKTDSTDAQASYQSASTLIAVVFLNPSRAHKYWKTVTCARGSIFNQYIRLRFEFFFCGIFPLLKFTNDRCSEVFHSKGILRNAINAF